MQTKEVAAGGCLAEGRGTSACASLALCGFWPGILTNSKAAVDVSAFTVVLLHLDNCSVQFIFFVLLHIYMQHLGFNKLSNFS